jgi:hypothetical protein
VTHTDTDAHTDDTDESPTLDRAAIDRDIAAGAKAGQELLRHAAVDWTHWSALILGLRGLRSLAFAKAGTTKMTSQAYRDAMSSLLSLRKHQIYDQLLDKQTRSDSYRLMDNLEGVDTWYAGLNTADKLRWKHPTTIAKHCPKHLLSGGLRGHNKPPSKGKQKPAVSFETERLKALLIAVIKRLTKYEPDAIDLLDQIHAVDPEDRVDDMYTTPAESED